MEEPRPAPPLAAGETETLVAFLEYFRTTMRHKADGLDAEQLARRLPPSSMTLGGMLKHLAYVEDWWFCCVLHGADAAPPFDAVDWRAEPDWDWHSAADDTPAELRELHARCLERSREALAVALAGPEGLDTRASRATRGGEPFSLRWILVHMVEEYARHCGHADLIRESIDGETGEAHPALR